MNMMSGEVFFASFHRVAVGFNKGKQGYVLAHHTKSARSADFPCWGTFPQSP